MFNHLWMLGKRSDQPGATGGLGTGSNSISNKKSGGGFEISNPD